jgi:DNA-binding winged helix-turn-helix (wHTH) protein
VYTHRLRKKLRDEDGRLLKTVPGIGYQLTAGPTTEHPQPATNP